ncbi:hypothetical protein K469DRAFT_385156 [Zopfia rhizophila CBS 207.26]|uniref:Heterokaryon incompatibility domain-containing protein n=1 Tax=Zopfia rhizophila CBS 207.26 TaxID=1314779 RepID=A0A6A6EH69_9PEZI|nr:hypothetical protein K469DRAFT_385156 [Zopfia rhizophila CBS 207.26]
MPVILSFFAQAIKNTETSTELPRTYGLPPPYVPEWEMLRRFFQQPWFYRVWTVQEIAVATNAIIVIGEWELDWKSFAQAAEYLSHTVYSVSTSMKASDLDASHRGLALDPAIYMCRMPRNETGRPMLLGLLALGRDRAATQPVDYVFAVLGLALELNAVENITVEDFLEPDYSKSAADVFRDVSCLLIHFHRSLDVLSEAEFAGSNKTMNCPSWVPAWSKRKKSSSIAHDEFKYSPDWSTLESSHRRLLHGTGYNADSKERMALLSFVEYKDTVVLCVNGLKLGSVTAVSEPLEAKEDDFTIRYRATPEEIKFVSSAWRLVERLGIDYQREERAEDTTLDSAPMERETTVISLLELHATYKTTEDILFAFFMTLCAKRSSNKRPHYQGGLDWFFYNFGNHIHSPPFTKRMRHFFRNLLSVDIRRIEYQAAVSSTCPWRRFFITSSGHMGLGPMSMEEGDVVAILFGSTVPFVLRPQPDLGKSRYVFIGECYCHGIMNGEVVEKWREKGGPAEVFELI